MRHDDGSAPVPVLQLLQGLAIGGIEQMVLALVSGLPRHDFATRFCTFDRVGALADDVRALGCPIHFRRRRGALDAGFVVWLARLVRRERIRIVHAHNATAFFYGAAATRLVPGTRFLYTEHDRAFPTPLRQRGLHAALARAADAVVTVSDTLRADLVRYECFPPARVHVVKNGVAVPEPRRARADVRLELGLGARPVAGIVARLAPVKNHALLLRAWKRVLHDVPAAVLLVVGNGTQEPALRTLTAELDLHDAVRFLGFRRDVADLLQAMDVFVLSSLSEGLSLTLLEAAAAGLPVVATRVGGNPEVVRDGATGCLVPSQDEPALAAALSRLLLDGELRAAMGRQGRALHRDHHTLQAMVAGYEALYRRLAAMPPARRPAALSAAGVAAGSSS